MNNFGLAAAISTMRRDGDDSRYDGWVGLSALPSAPVVEDRRRQWGGLGRIGAALRLRRPRLRAAVSPSRAVPACTCPGPAGMAA